MVCAPSSFAHPTGIELTTSCLQTAESQIPRKIRPDVVLTCGTLGQTRVPIEYHLHAKTRRLAGTSSSGANRDRTGDLLLAKQALSQLSYGPRSLNIRATERISASERSCGPPRAEASAGLVCRYLPLRRPCCVPALALTPAIQASYAEVLARSACSSATTRRASARVGALTRRLVQGGPRPTRSCARP
jgi:hypothetical protein